MLHLQLSCSVITQLLAHQFGVATPAIRTLKEGGTGLLKVEMIYWGLYHLVQIHFPNTLVIWSLLSWNTETRV